MNNTFGTRLAQFRKAQNLTQNEIADQLHVSYQAVSKWENDLTSPDSFYRSSQAFDFNRW